MTFTTVPAPKPVFRAEPEGDAPAFPLHRDSYAYQTPGSSFKSYCWYNSQEGFNLMNPVPKAIPLLSAPFPLGFQFALLLSQGAKDFGFHWNQEVSRQFESNELLNPVLKGRESPVGQVAIRIEIENPAIADIAVKSHPLSGLRVVPKKAGITKIKVRLNEALSWTYDLGVG